MMSASQDESTGKYLREVPLLCVASTVLPSSRIQAQSRRTKSKCSQFKSVITPILSNHCELEFAIELRLLIWVTLNCIGLN